MAPAAPTPRTRCSATRRPELPAPRPPVLFRLAGFAAPSRFRPNVQPRSCSGQPERRPDTAAAPVHLGDRLSPGEKAAREMAAAVEAMMNQPLGGLAAPATEPA